MKAKASSHTESESKSDGILAATHWLIVLFVAFCNFQLRIIG